MAPQELHDDDKHKVAPTSTCTPPSSNGNPSGAVHPTTSSPPSDASGHRPAAANSFPLVLKVMFHADARLQNLIRNDSCSANHFARKGILPETNSDGVPGGGSEGEQKEVRGKLADAYARHIAPAVKLDICSHEAASAGGIRRGASRAEWTAGWCAQFSVLLRRGLKERRHESFNKLRIFQVLSVAFLAGLLWWRTPAAHLQDRTALIFFFSVFWGFFPLYNAVFVFPLERPMLLKERSSGMYRLSSYFAARTAADLPMELGLPTAFVLILYWMGGLDPRPASFLLSLLVVLYSVLVAQSLGLAVGAVLMDVKQGTTLASVITMVFLIAGGYYVQHIPPFIGWLKWLNYSFYCYRLLLGIQFRDGGGLYDCGGGALCPIAEFPAIKAVGLNNHWVDVCVMALLLVGYRVVAYLALDRLQPR
ncbi:unnamed protein product [Triticum turgidum subsp. durum]|uniref:ABC-2 type transporter transmembrane domain-containing protein n=1 Tax=Triticum turgidum subsp. durum TaxID=4567 RepID=A0A9R0Z1E7_TRITD|nr:unnamed protein product [Triticum turgidum subsp. durum]